MLCRISWSHLWVDTGLKNKSTLVLRGRELEGGHLCKFMFCFRQIEGLLWWPRWYRICLPCLSPRFDPWVGKIPWRRAWQPPPVFLPGESHGWRSLGFGRVGLAWVTNESFTFGKQEEDRELSSDLLLLSCLQLTIILRVKWRMWGWHFLLPCSVLPGRMEAHLTPCRYFRKGCPPCRHGPVLGHLAQRPVSGCRLDFILLQWSWRASPCRPQPAWCYPIACPSPSFPCACVRGCVPLCVVPWPAAPLSGVSQTRRLEWIAVSSSREPPWPRGQTRVFCVSCIGQSFLY